MTRILLTGNDAAVLEGLAQSLGALAYAPTVAYSLSEARELALRERPLVAVVARAMASSAASDVLRLPLASGGALVLYRKIGEPCGALAPALQRAVLADLTLPLERSRLVALIQHVRDRARAAGRDERDTGQPEQRP